MSGGKLSHLQINVRQEHLPFYKDLFTFLGWESTFSDDWGEAFKSVDGLSLWFMTGAKDVRTDYDGPGVNHIAIAADSQAAVDATVAYLTEQGVDRLFETPRHRSDFSQGDNTYYQVMFESPDGILFEHVYTGPKQD